MRAVSNVMDASKSSAEKARNLGKNSDKAGFIIGKQHIGKKPKGGDRKAAPYLPRKVAMNAMVVSPCAVN